MRFSRLSLLAVAALCAALLPGCGSKGPLYLRDNPPAGTRIPKPATPAPVPYPAYPADEPAKKRD